MTSFAQTGDMGYGFEMYTDIPEVTRINRKMLMESGKSKVPACNPSGEKSLLFQVAKEQTTAPYVEAKKFGKSGHYCAEEHSTDLVKKLLAIGDNHNRAQ